MATNYPWGKSHSDIFPASYDHSCGMTSEDMRRREQRVKEADQLRNKIREKEKKLDELLAKDPISILKKEIKVLEIEITKLDN